MRAMHRVGGTVALGQHQAHPKENSSLHYLSPNGAHVKPEIVKSTPLR